MLHVPVGQFVLGLQAAVLERPHVDLHLVGLLPHDAPHLPGLARLPQVLPTNSCHGGPKARDALRRVAVFAGGPSPEAIETLESDSRLPLVTAFEAQDLAFLRF